MTNQKFKIIVLNYPYNGVVDYPHAIFRTIDFVGELNINNEIDVTDCGIEDPNNNDLFIVYVKVDGDLWVCEFRGMIVLVEWISLMTGFKGDRFLDVGYYYLPYVPIVRSSNDLDDNFNSIGRILSKYGKKLLKEESEIYGK